MDEMERRHTLRTAVVRYDELRTRDALAASALEARDEGEDVAAGPALTQAEALELLALGEVLARKAAYGRQLGVRSARAAGASWAQIGGALGLTKQAAWEAHTRWIDEQVGARHRVGHEGFDPADEAAARRLAGPDGDR